VVKEIQLIGNPILRENTEVITRFDSNLSVLVNDLKDTLIDFQNRKGIGRGIAAPQIGVLKKVIYIHMPNRSFPLINPQIIWKSEETFKVWDSCFSFDAAFFVYILRHKSVEVKYQNIKGEFINETFSDDISELLQHEIDHLDGILATDYLTNNNDIVLREEWEKRYK
jgi:peptide deformylase